MNTTTQEQRAKDGGRFLIGHTSNQLKQANVDDYDIYFGKSKIARILLNLEMTPQIIKEVADVIEAPVIVMDSKTVPGSITMFGNSKMANGKPVMVSMLLHPTTKTGEILDYGVVTSAYGRRTNNAQNLIDTSNIRYIDPNSKRTGEWMKALGLHLPSASSTAGSEEIDRSSTSHAPDGAQVDISRPTIASSDNVAQQEQTVKPNEAESAADEESASAREGLPQKAKDYLTRAENKLLRGSTEKPRYLPAPGMTEEKKTRLNAERKNTHEAPRYLEAPWMTEKANKDEISALMQAAYAERKKQEKNLTSGELGVTLPFSERQKSKYEPDIRIPFGVGAKAKDILVKMPDGEIATLVPGTAITKIETIAGKGRNRKIDEIEILLVKYPGTDAANWQKKKGICMVNYHGENYRANLHWYEEPSVGRVKLKVKPDANGNWFYED